MSGHDESVPPRPLEVETGFAEKRERLLEHGRVSELSAARKTDLLYFEGMAAVEEAVAAGGAGEDAEPEPKLLQRGRQTLAAAGTEFHDQMRSAEEALTGFQIARALSRVKSHPDLHREAVDRLRKALGNLDTTRHPALALEAFLLLAEMLHGLASIGNKGDREAQLDRALASAHAAEYLATALEDLQGRARQRRLNAMILADRFQPDRDENLLDAIASAGEALALYRGNSNREAVEYGSLLVVTGNAWLKVAGDRAAALKRARDCFREGVARTDATALPRLARVLAGNLTMTEKLIASGDHALPENEMVGRFDAKIHASIDANRLLDGIENAWAFMHWAWTLPATPNVHVGAAHKFLGGLYFRNGDMPEAELHLYSSLAVFCAVLQPGQPEFPLVEQTRQDLEKFFLATRQSEKAAAACAQARQAVSTAHDRVRRGAARLESEPAAARADFEAALRLFPTSPDALFYRGVTHMTTGQDHAAQADFSAALMFRPRHIPSLGNRFTVRLRLGDRDGALADCDAILEIDPKHDGALRHRAELRSEKHDWDGAIADLDEFLKLHPGDAHSLVLRAAAREQKGDIAGSIADLEQAMGSVTDPEGLKKFGQKIAALRPRL